MQLNNTGVKIHYYNMCAYEYEYFRKRHPGGYFQKYFEDGIYNKELIP